MQFISTSSGRLDAILAAHQSGTSRSAIVKTIQSGMVCVNGTVIRKSSKQIKEGDIVVLSEESLVKSESSAIVPVNLHLEVLYEDESLFVINKPAGIAVHPGHSMDQDEKTLLNGIAYLFAERSIPFSADAVLVHRLDKPTTGCIIVAKSKEAHGYLQLQFENRTTRKQYLALVSGVPKHSEATIDAPIGRNLTDRTKMSVLKTSVSREAKTTYRVLDSSDDCALLSCDLHTGRTHQIRVHLSSIGHPILGDTVYSSPASQKVTDTYDISGLCLHAQKVTFVSPADTKEHIVAAPMSKTLQDALQAASITV